MSKRIVLIPVVVVALCFFVSSSLMAQSKDDGDRLLQEGLELQGNARSKEDLEKALKKYEEALSIFRKAGDGINEGQTLKNLGNVYSNLRDPDKATAYYEEALKVARKAGHLATEGQVQNNLGNIYKDRRQYSQAVEYFEKSLEVTRRIGDLRVQGITCNNLGELYSSAGQYGKAVEYYESALAVARELKNRPGQSATLNMLGNVYSHLGQYDKAVEYYEKSLVIKRELKDRSGEGQILGNLGGVYHSWGQNDKAVDYYEKSLAIAREVEDRMPEGKALNNLGIVYEDWGQYDKAVDYYEKSLAIKRELKDRKGEGMTLNNLGVVYKRWGQDDKAVVYYEKSLAIARELRDRKGEGRALNNLGVVYKDWGQNEKAVECYEKSLAIARELKDPRGEGQTLNNLGTVYRGWGQYEKAVEYYEKDLAICRELKDPAGEGGALGSLGIVYYDRGEYEKAVECYEKSLAIARELKNRKSEGGSLNQLGVVYWRWGQYDKAVDYYEKSLAIARELKDPRGEGQTLNNLGILYSDWGRNEKAVEYYEKDLAICRELKDPAGEGTALNNLGVVYGDWGQYDKAVECYEKSLAIMRALKNRIGEGDSLNNLGTVYADWGQFEKAADSYEKSLVICRELKDRKSEGQTLNNLGKVYSAWRVYDKALASFQRGLEIYKMIGVPTGLPNNNIGNLYLDIGEVEKAGPFIKEGNYTESMGRLSLLKADYLSAKTYYETLLRRGEKSRKVHNLFTAYTGLGTVYEGLVDNKKAEECYLKAVNLTEELRSNLPKAQRETFFDVRINGFLRTAPYDGLARVRIKLNRPVEAFKDSEYTKSRIFAESMSKWSEGKGFDIPADILKQDRELNDQLAALKKKRQEGYEKANQEIISVIEPQVKEMEAKLQSHVKMLREKFPLFAATKYPEPMDMRQTALKDNEWVLAYHVTDPGIIIYLTRGKEIIKALFKPIPRDNLDNLVVTFRKPLEMIPGKDNFEEKLKSFDLTAGKKLSDLLLSDVLEGLPKNISLLIVPDDSLGTLPFEMLVLNDKGTIKTDKDLPYISGADFFGDRNLISYSQSVTALTLSRIHAKSKAKEAGLLAIADPVFHEKDERTAKAGKMDAPTGVMASLFKRLNLMAAENDPQMGGLKFQRLSMTGELAQTLAEQGKKNAKVCIGFDATKTNFLGTIAPQLNKYDEVVFATHGYFGKDLPGIMEPVLVLTLIPPGTDGFLRMTEVMGLNMNADIVALTACQTGLGKRTAGEGTMGMGRAFQYAGAKSVLMSLWSVSEVASVNLVKSFFRGLKDGKSKSEALASARDEIRKKGFDHPFFWSGFILVGESN
jgi:tetratricopeptide (TPR) repeat protein/CHAT domain-containing protein